MTVRCCEHGPCGRSYHPRRFDQRFCSVWCRRNEWSAAHPRLAHPAVEPSRRFDPCWRGRPATAGQEASETPFRVAS